MWRAWARERGIGFVAGDELPATPGDFRRDVRLDYGRLQAATPGFSLAPRSVDELAACMAALAAERVPYKLRGAAHSASGEVLSAGGAIVELGGLRGIVADDPEAGEITALGGTTWLELWEHLAARGARPPCLTTNPRVTLAGTLAVGGVGDGSHVVGPQVSTVRRLVLVTPDGARHALAPGDPYFAHALCGHGQLGAIAEVTLATVRRGSTIAGRVLRWGSLDAFLDDHTRLGEFDYVRGRLLWHEGIVRVWAVVATATATLPAFSSRTVIAATGVDTFDLLADARTDPTAQWPAFNPCVELALPYPSGLAALRAIDTRIAHGPLARLLPRGSSLGLVAATRGLPLSAFRHEPSALLAVRPEPKTLEDARLCEPELRALADLALAGGGAIYLASFARPDAVPADAARSLAELRRALDPHALCNRGALFGWQP